MEENPYHQSKWENATVKLWHLFMVCLGHAYPLYAISFMWLECQTTPGIQVPWGPQGPQCW